MRKIGIALIIVGLFLLLGAAGNFDAATAEGTTVNVFPTIAIGLTISIIGLATWILNEKGRED